MWALHSRLSYLILSGVCRDRGECQLSTHECGSRSRLPPASTEISHVLHGLEFPLTLRLLRLKVWFREVRPTSYDAHAVGMNPRGWSCSHNEGERSASLIEGLKPGQ